MRIVGLVVEEPKKAPKTEKKAQSDAEYVCEECGKAFTSKAALTGHMRAHRGEKA